MLGTPVLGLIVVLWLFVLAPIALRSRKPIRHTNEAFEETRVIHEGGAELPVSRRRPRLTADDMHISDELDEDYEVVDDSDILIDEPADNATPFSKLGNAFSKIKKPSKAEPVIDGDVVAELPAAQPADADSLDQQSEGDDIAAQAERKEPAFAEYDEDEETTYAYDEAYTNPADFLHDSADYGEAVYQAEEDATDDESAEDPAEEAELTDADLEFAARRRGRGGYDPEADALASSNRFQRRQRTLIALGVTLVVATVVAVVMGGMAWVAPGLVLVLTAAYLFALRQQVRAENELRARRIRHMRRARLGVRTSEDAELGMPSRLRRPGAVVLELDDDSPDFDYLPTAELTYDHDSETGNVVEFTRPRRVS
ncbi:divisome protein SepX/GlpR [Corynebacterium epidermidicanis]|uniref:Uncharacterized protein n=1 Tax=Corynebacterium epidermidicanis TaxID=1050174 RepID=A0A0G3GQ55_9CORY|nr:gephyrin-like molybdotransferase receptor GlpR [Corynebacterium epidermidicanis]AKK02685.1 hypothetical protein CEPID_04060 [Corynebacterium epidermidicanis]